MALKEFKEVIAALPEKYDHLPVRVPIEWREPDFVKEVEVLYEGIPADQQMILINT